MPKLTPLILVLVYGSDRDASAQTGQTNPVGALLSL